MEEPMSNQLIVNMFEQISKELSEIKTQTTNTNGSVRDLQIWRGYITGILGVVVVVLVPLLLNVLKK